MVRERDKPRSRPSWAGTLRAGPDSAERSEDILRSELGRPAWRRPSALTAADLDRMADLVETYADLPLGTASAQGEFTH
jgi:hypothetical protein